MISFAKFYYLIFGLLTIVGGYMGFRAGHSASLIAGGISGALLLVASFLIPGKLQVAFVIGLIVSVALAGKFLPAFIEKKAIFPAGVMALLSIISLVVTLLAWYRR